MRDIHLEIVYEGHQCPASHYMAQAVEEVLPLFEEGTIRVTRIDYKKHKTCADRLIELSIALYGEDALRKQMRTAPIPSIFIDGRLVFDVIPQKDELIEAIERSLERKEAEP
jgi:hypothetical protein